MQTLLKRFSDIVNGCITVFDRGNFNGKALGHRNGPGRGMAWAYGYNVIMPKMTGDMLAKAFIALRPDLPVILYTGFSVSITEEITDRLEIRALVMKPVLMNQIAATVRRVMDSRQA